MTMKKGFSFVELMVVVVIVGIAATLAAPSYSRYTEKSRGRTAAANLAMIYSMEKRYKLDNGVYYDCGGSTTCTTTIINNALGLYIRDPYFSYSIEATAKGRAEDLVDTGEAGYKATATRDESSRLCGGKVITASADSSDIIKTDCPVW